ncbi:RNAse P Rpr2/Rpp21 subunit domain-containing protein [Ophiocordyceps camponoti-floridani]|uniref:RNAse P Rpr2/Rpp21 subunit domain-containing protein n=1 Tax=Ophiocordyceps camponoti-floridani TaxID=2030778 RepID=A0A8H4Q2R8_9HYPO|nr:RNAse P Rpr2/Rpp21 subunit domain-containing protein [Ophiocordyceps camponoti-floridani]
MAKRTNTSVPNKAIYSRASYLFQAATYFSHRARQAASSSTSSTTDEDTKLQQKQLRNLSRRAIADMRAVTRKAQIRQVPSLKRSLCSACNTLLVEGDSCLSTVENASKGARKPWADVLVIRCVTCRAAKRFPVDAPRQARAAMRRSEAAARAGRSGDPGPGSRNPVEPGSGV